MNPLRILQLDLSPRASGGQLDPLSGAEAAESFFRSLPRREPLTSQRLLCEALARAGEWRAPGVGQLAALVALDRGAQPLFERLLGDYLALSSQSPEAESQLRHATVELSRAFASGYDSFVRHARNAGVGAAWAQRLPFILIQFFKHREVELLLSLFRYEPWPRSRWSEVNAAYRFALAHEVADRPVVRERREGRVIRTLTPGQAFTRLQLLRLVDASALAPAELTAARRWIAGWSMLARLRRPGDAAPTETQGFVLDLSGADGLRRLPATDAAEEDLLHLDTTPVVAAIEKELATPPDASAAAGRAISPTRRLILLLKLKRALAPRPERFARRGERTQATLLSVRVFAGGPPRIFRLLRDEARQLAARQGSAVSHRDGMTITESPLNVSPADATASRPSVWQVRDRSDSGYRLQGRIANAHQFVPGSLIALREHEAGPWTLAVVRRLRRSVGKNIELGVERLGCDPQCVVLRAAAVGAPAPATGEQARRSIGFFLLGDNPRAPTSGKTLVLPAGEHAPGRELTMLSRTTEATIRLGDALEHQSEFVCAALELLDTRSRLH